MKKKVKKPGVISHKQVQDWWNNDVLPLVINPIPFKIWDMK